MATAKKKKGFSDYLAGAWKNAKSVAKRDMGRMKAAIGEAPTGIKSLRRNKDASLKDVELHRVKDIGK